MQGFASKIVAGIRNSISSFSRTSSFHTTSASLAKRKVDSDAKTHIRYSVHHKRADAKRALKDILLNGKVCSDHFQGENRLSSKNSMRSKSQKSCSGKGKQSKRWLKKKCFSDDGEDEQPEVIFTANFGGQRSFTWSFNTWENKKFENCTTGFQWKDDIETERNRKRIWSESDIEEEETSDINLHYDRVALGLPSSGLLCLNDIKRAFRESAMKWHPDKHHGLAQVRYDGCGCREVQALC